MYGSCQTDKTVEKFRVEDDPAPLRGKVITDRAKGRRVVLNPVFVIRDHEPQEFSTMNLLAYHITWGTYGTRLHGDPRKTVDRLHNQYGDPVLGYDEHR